jgi:nucleoid-associated protein YgaU
MGILDFLSKKNSAAPAPSGATDTAAASPDALKGELTKLGIDASKVDIAVDGSTVTLSGSAATTADSEKIALTIGNTKGVSRVVNDIAVATPAAESHLYTVKAGDTLSKISKIAYGDPNKYQKIFEANRPMLKDPDHIYPGQVLRIPDATEPMAGTGAAPATTAAAEGLWKPPAEVAGKSDDVVWKAPTT